MLAAATHEPPQHSMQCVTHEASSGSIEHW